jgi:hypothetical protein
MSGLCEALGELGVEAVQPAHVGDDHDPDGRRRGRAGERGGERRAVLRAQRDDLCAGASGEGREDALGRQLRRVRVVVEAHAPECDRSVTVSPEEV